MKITIGALAHVDAGKTSLSESILYLTSAIRNKGRVDHKNAFLDYNSLEKEKGITIFNKEARFSYKDNEYIYLDTPGHSDLQYEANRAINILDCAIIIISAIEEIPSDTIKMFTNLCNRGIPVLIFVNKMDITSFTRDEIMAKLKNYLDANCIGQESIMETVALKSDELLDVYLKEGKIDDINVINSLRSNEIFPCFFGSALKDEGIIAILDFIDRYIRSDYDKDGETNAYIYRISKDYSYLKILSGSIQNKASFGEHKINEMYRVNGQNLESINVAEAGDIIAVKGLSKIAIGTYLPSFSSDKLLELPSLTYRIISSLETNELFKKLDGLNGEFPELQIRMEGKDVFISLNGELHSLIVKNIIKERLDIDVDFSSPIIRYKETIKDEAFGIGHFEPLRHYGEVIVKIKPYGKGFKVSSRISNSYINTLLSYLRSYPLRGILTNSQLTDIEIEIIDIKTHPKHTEGQDLIQSLRRAIRQGLSKIESILLEPNYIVTINADDNTLNSIIAELSNLKCLFTIEGNNIVTTIALRNLNETLLSLKSRLKGNLSYSIDELVYMECSNPEEVIAERGYDYRSDMHNPAGSIFCKSGAGHYVEPEHVEENMHLNMSDYTDKVITHTIHNKSTINEDELKRVWNSIYKPKPRYIPKQSSNNEERVYIPKPSKPLLYLIDGYNLMYCYDEELAFSDLINAREKTINLVCDFAGYVNAETVLVFDAYKSESSKTIVNRMDNITIVYTKEKQTADTYIELKSKELKNDYKIIVVTSDSLEQLRVYSNDASIISSREFLNRYENFRRNSKHLSTYKPFRPFEDLKNLLERNEEEL